MAEWILERPVDCESCKGQGNHSNTPRIKLITPITDGAPRGSVVCEWCGIEVTGPTLSEAIAKWRGIQELIRLGYYLLKSNESKKEDKIDAMKYAIDVQTKLGTYVKENYLATKKTFLEEDE